MKGKVHHRDSGKSETQRKPKDGLGLCEACSVNSEVPCAPLRVNITGPVFTEETHKAQSKAPP